MDFPSKTTVLPAPRFKIPPPVDLLQTNQERWGPDYKIVTAATIVGDKYPDTVIENYEFTESIRKTLKYHAKIRFFKNNDIDEHTIRKIIPYYIPERYPEYEKVYKSLAEDARNEFRQQLMGTNQYNRTSTLADFVEAIIGNREFQIYLSELCYQVAESSQGIKSEAAETLADSNSTKETELQSVFGDHKKRYLEQIDVWMEAEKGEARKRFGEQVEYNNFRSYPGSLRALKKRIELMELWSKVANHQNRKLPPSETPYDNLSDKDQDSVWDMQWTPRRRITFYSGFKDIVAIDNMNKKDDGAAEFMRRTFITSCKAMYDRVVAPRLAKGHADPDWVSVVALPEEVWDTLKELSITTPNYKAEPSEILVTAARPRILERSIYGDESPPREKPKTTPAGARDKPKGRDHSGY
jgi:hypothetical protein